MSTYSETILQRYAASEQEIDAFGRTIKVQRLRPWDEATVRKLAGTDTFSVMSIFFVASCVREITDEAGKQRLFAPPKSESDIAIVMNALDEEGMQAALKAFCEIKRQRRCGWQYPLRGGCH